MSSGSYRPPWIARRAAEAAAVAATVGYSNNTDDDTSSKSSTAWTKPELLKLKKPWIQNANQIYRSSTSFIDVINRWYIDAWTKTPELDLILMKTAPENGDRIVRLECRYGQDPAYR